MKKKEKDTLVMIFGTARHGEVMVKIDDIRPDLNMRIVRAEAEKLILTYRTKQGVALLRLRRAYVVRRSESDLPE